MSHTPTCRFVEINDNRICITCTVRELRELEALLHPARGRLN